MAATIVRNCCRRVLSAVAFTVALAAVSPLGAQQAPIQTQDANASGVVAELMECKREEGVLTVRVRFRNTADKPAELTVVEHRNYDAYYVTAGSKKYFVLRDSEKTPLAPAVSSGGSLYAKLNKGDSFNWWAKYPAPPAEVKKVSFFSPLAPPFDNVPVKD